MPLLRVRAFAWPERLGNEQELRLLDLERESSPVGRLCRPGRSRRWRWQGAGAAGAERGPERLRLPRTAGAVPGQGEGGKADREVPAVREATPMAQGCRRKAEERGALLFHRRALPGVQLWARSFAPIGAGQSKL